MIKKQNKTLSIDELVKKITQQVIKETLAPLEGSSDREEERQKQMSDELKALKQSDSKKTDEDLDEADEEEKEEEKKTDSKSSQKKEEPKSEPKEKVVSSKIATGKEEPKEPKAVIPDPSEIKDVTFNQVVNMMNMMRSGKSAKDPDTKQKLGDYFKGLNPGERQALFVLLSGLTQILAGGVAGDEAPDPSAVGIKIDPRRSEEEPKEPAAGKAAAPAAVAPKAAAPKSAGPVPIVVGEAADRSDIRKLLASLRK